MVVVAVAWRRRWWRRVVASGVVDLVDPGERSVFGVRWKSFPEKFFGGDGGGRSWNRPTFFNDNEENYVQYKEYLENPSNEIAALNFNQEKEGPPQDSDIRQLIREECCIKVCREQKKNIEDTMIELVEEVKNVVEQPTECGTRITASLENFRVKKSSISLNNKSQVSLVHAITPVLPTKEPEYSFSMGYEHLSTTPEIETDKVIESSVKNLLPIPREYEVTLEDKRECNVLVCKDSSPFDASKEHSEILSDSNDDDISSDDDAFEDVDASPLDSEIVRLEEENDVYQEDEEIDLKDILQIQDVILREKLLSINRLIADIESLNDKDTPDRVLNSSTSILIFEESERLTSVVKNDISDDSTNDPLLEKVDLFLASDNSIPSGIGNIDYDSERDIHFLEELLVDDSILFPKNESSDFDHHDDPSFPRPPLKPPDVKFFFDLEPNSEEISDKLNEDECFDPGGEINVFANDEDDDYFPFIFVSV
uniref:Uncharacterized protein n=1 Tax=Tanacetum cinerariifolium TaxID=118510 RepID=A0A699IFA6_TANCI|nr:hypothetical protein [Tanacetum cinerariifolium]